MKWCFVSLVGAFLVSACAVPPYVHKASRYDRSVVGFGLDATDIDAVTICYSSYEGSSAEVVRLAIEACGAFGKTANFEDQDYFTCPLAAPVAANYTCDLPTTGIIGTSSGIQ